MRDFHNRTRATAFKCMIHLHENNFLTKLKIFHPATDTRTYRKPPNQCHRAVAHDGRPWTDISHYWSIKNSGTALLLATVLVWPMGNTAFAEITFPANLAGHAMIPAFTMLTPPADAPKDAQVSGKFTGLSRNEVPGSVMGDTGASHGKRPTGIRLPFQGQPFQGLSGFAMDRASDGAVYALTDNGFGTKSNSSDAMLFFHRLLPDFAAGIVAIQATIFLADADHKVPFRIAYGGTDSRYLTGSDFDIESIQIAGGTVWLGDEFGPYIINTSMEGHVIAVYPTMLGEAVLKGPESHGISAVLRGGHRLDGAKIWRI